MPAATATADPPLDPPGMRSERPRIARRAERRVLGRRSHRELVAVGLADDDRAGRLEPRDHGGVVRRHEGFEHPRRGGRADAARAEVVLERDRARRQRRVAPARRGRDRSRRRAPAPVRAVTVLKACSAGRSRVDARQRLAADLDRGLRPPGAQSRIAKLVDGRAHPMTRGTRKRPASSDGVRRVGAAPSSRSSEGRTSSGRSDSWRVDDAGGRRRRRSCRSLHLRRRRRGCRRAGGRTARPRAVELEMRERGDRCDLRASESQRAWQMLALEIGRSASRVRDGRISRATERRLRPSPAPGIPARRRRWPRAVDGYLAAAERTAAPTSTRSIALIAPHAGLMYSGPVAAYAYRLLRGRPFDVVVLVGSVALRRFRRRRDVSGRRLRDAVRRRRRSTKRCAVGDHGRRADRPRARRGARPRALARDAAAVSAAAGARAPIVPLVMGCQTAETAARAGRRARRGARRPPRAARRQHRPVALSRRRDRRARSTRSSSTTSRGSTPTACSARSTRTPDHACGGGPTVAVMRAARRAWRPRRARAQLRRLRRRLGRQVVGRRLPGGGVRASRMPR